MTLTEATRMDSGNLPRPPYHLMVDGMLHVDKNSHILSADAPFARMIDISEAELTGRSWFSLFHPFDRDRIDTALDQLARTGRGHAVLRIATSGATIVHLYVHLCRADSALDGDYYCLVQDLATRTDFHPSQQHYERLFMISNDLLCVANTMGYFLQVNPAFTRLLGYDEKELLNTTFLDFIHPDDVDATLKELRKLRSGQDTLHFQNRYRCKDGSWRWLAWSTPASNEEGILYAVAKDITERKIFEDQLMRQAKFDYLTGLPNRGYLDDELERAMARARRGQHVLTGFFIDLDDFREVNARHGLELGDDLLRQMAMRLRTLLRANDFVARIGGDEFFVLAELAQYAKTLHLAEKIAAVLQHPFLMEDGQLQIAASVGVMPYKPEQHPDGSSFISQCEKAMLASKQRQKQADTATGQNPQPAPIS